MVVGNEKRCCHGPGVQLKSQLSTNTGAGASVTNNNAQAAKDAVVELINMMKTALSLKANALVAANGQHALPHSVALHLGVTSAPAPAPTPQSSFLLESHTHCETGLV